MASGSNRLTNLLLVAVVVLLLANLAVPVARRDPPALSTPPAAAPAADAEEIADLVARVELLLRDVPRPAPAAPGPGEDEVVVRIPGRLADELGITAEDVRTVVTGLARVAKSAGTARKGSNETAAIATLRNCSSAQAQFQATAKADLDRDGVGEFGAFVELSGEEPIRGLAGNARLNPPVLSGAFRKPSPEGFVSRSGYRFLIYLPDGGGGGVAPDASGFGHVDPEKAETTWCAYAWPARYGETGRLTFMVNQAGDVLATDARAYTGTNAPLPGAAFLDGGRYSIDGAAAVGATGQDGNEWRQVN